MGAVDKYWESVVPADQLDDQPLTGVRRFTSVLHCGPGLTQQSFADEVDINKIVAKLDKTGMIAHLNAAQPFYGDVSGLISFQDAQNIVARGEELFMSLTADIRERFLNDPARLIAFLNDEANRDEAVKLGIVTPKPVDNSKPTNPEPVPAEPAGTK